MQLIVYLLTNRNFILITSLVLAFVFGEYAVSLKSIPLYVLAFVMVFSTTSINFKHLFPVSKNIHSILLTFLIGFLAYDILILVPAWFWVPKEYFPGFIVVAITPPGVAVIPFTHILKGDINYSIAGLIGGFLTSLIIAPVILGFFAPSGEVNIFKIVLMMVEVIIVPLILSRLLLYKRIFPIVKKVRGQVVNWGFALIIFIAVGVNSRLIISNIQMVIIPAIILNIRNEYALFSVRSIKIIILQKCFTHE